MLNRFRLGLLAPLLAGFVATGCSVDKKGIATANDDASTTDAAGGRDASAGVDGSVGTGGTIVAGTGGRGGAPAGTGSGGSVSVGTGGHVGVGTGGNVTSTGGSGLGTSGGAPGSGGSVGSGGETGSGGAVGPGTGGDGPTGTGGVVGSGGVVGTGGAGTGGTVGTGGRGTGGATSSCNASTCPNGCCNGNNCVTSRNDLRCGTAGAACAACAPCFQCSNAGVCGLIANAEWDIICVSATITPTKPAGGAWDVTGMDSTAPPDPYCQLTLDNIRRTSTDTVMQSFSPMWNESIAPNAGTNLTHSVLVAQPTRWSVAVVDEDGGTITLNDPVCSVSPRLTAEDFAAGVVKLPATEGCSSLVIRLECAED